MPVIQQLRDLYTYAISCLCNYVRAELRSIPSTYQKKVLSLQTYT